MKMAKKTFELTTKSNMLKILSTKLKKSKIEKIFDFTIEQFEENENNIIKKIQDTFNDETIILRSSALDEDSIEKSNAGNYESVMEINTKYSKKIYKGIKIVIESYHRKGNFNKQNQILVQKQTENIICSGVIFTKNPTTGGPYYVINYEEGPSTTGVTQGQINNTCKIFRLTLKREIPTKWKKLIQSIKEIESVIKSDSIDVEFGITKNFSIVIFQVRPMTTINQNTPKNIEKILLKIIKDEKKKFMDLNKKKSIYGKKTIFSDMSDWNPAEIIGDQPNLLDYSIYNKIIMKDVWSRSREILGYQKIESYPLMVKFGNKPYVDTRASFNSLIPNNIKKLQRKKLINYYFKKLYFNKHLHDKIEFEILFSCFDFNIDQRLVELKKFDFNNLEIEELKKVLFDFTKDIIFSFIKIENYCNNAILKLSNNREQIVSKLSKNSDFTEYIYGAEELLKGCREWGTIPFAVMARVSFIASILLRSLKFDKTIENEIIENFMLTITTPLTKIQKDVELYSRDKISKKEFLKKYGHLRPGTYDITAQRYDKENNFLDDVKFIKNFRDDSSSINKNKIIDILSKNGFELNDLDFFEFVEKSIIQREELKFEFTKNLSDAIELIAKAGKKLGFSRNDMANLSIEYILKNKKYEKDVLKKKFKKKIINQKNKFSLNKFLILPPVITSKNDFNFIEYFLSKPNFITTKKISGEIIILNQLNNKKINLENKIVIIENADPGYDWIFAKKPIGLITKYGGIASHMSIRCQEIGLTAAIGCGDLLYEQIINSIKIIIDGKNEKIIILENKKFNESIEERKILRSLGYIK